MLLLRRLIGGRIPHSLTLFPCLLFGLSLKTFIYLERHCESLRMKGHAKAWHILRLARKNTIVQAPGERVSLQDF